MNQPKDYVFAAIVVIAVSTIKILVPGIGDEAPAILYLMGIFLVATFGSPGSALFATALSALAVNLLFSAPRFGLSIDARALTRAVIILAEGSLVTWFAYRAKTAHSRLIANQTRLDQANRRITDLMEEILNRDLENQRHPRSVRKER